MKRRRIEWDRRMDGEEKRRRKKKKKGVKSWP